MKHFSIAQTDSEIEATQPTFSKEEPSAPFYESIEEGKPTTLPRKNAKKRKERPKNVTFAPQTLNDYVKPTETAVIKRAYTPYYDATHLMDERRNTQNTQ